VLHSTGSLQFRKWEIDGANGELLSYIFANDCFIAMTAYGTDEIAFGPKFTSPQTLFDGRDTVEDLAGRETFDDLDNLGRAVARHRLHQKVDVISVFSALQIQ
jgi:hypothetical protein